MISTIFITTMSQLPEASVADLLEAFCQHYHQFESSIHNAVSNSADPQVLWWLGDDLDQYIHLVNQVLMTQNLCVYQLIIHWIIVLQYF
jgi:hypothetical protein